MGRRNKRLIIEQLEITDIGSEGNAIGKYNNKVVFIPKLIPGDIIDARVIGKKKNYLTAIPINYHKYSSLRQKHACEHFIHCGGCKWQHLPYQHQLKYKHKQVIDAIERIGKIIPEQYLDIVGAETIYKYRNKLEFTFSNKRWLTEDEINSDNEFMNRNALGFHIPKMFDKILDINECLLQEAPSNAIRNEIKEYAQKHNLPFFDIRNQTGWLRTLVIRNNSAGNFMVIVSFFYEDSTEREKLLSHLQQKFPEITSLMFVINEKGNDSFTDLEIKLFHGDGFLMEDIDHVKFKISPKSFFQTNLEQTKKLYRKTAEFAQLSGNEVVYDLYTGTGTIANYIAKDCEKVIGIEYVEDAIEDAKINAELNNIQNTSFYAGDLKDVLNARFIDEQRRPDVIITDPPRAGMHADVVHAIKYAAPKRIVYVSCNPATQARDVALLADEYRLVSIQPFDMFPHTHHVENIALLEKK